MTPSKLLRLVVRLAVAVAVLFAAALVPAHAQQASIQTSPPAIQETSVPRLVQFNGTLKDAGARPVAGVASVTFAIYAEQDGGAALWSETQNVIADTNGHYNALLGGATPSGMPAELFGTGQSRWLGVTIARQPEMPRVLLASVPYALKAGDAETLGGLPASAYVTTQSLAAKSSTTILAPGNTTIASTVQNSAGASSESGAPATGASSATPATLPISNATPTGSGTTDFIPLWTSSSALSNSILFQTGGLVGIGTTAPAETLDVNGNSIFRGSFQLPPGHPAIASSGYESHSFQFQASSFNSTTNTSNTEAFGFRAEPLNNNTANPSAKLDLFFGAGGSAPFTDTGFSFAANGVVTFAPGQSFSGTSSTVNEINLPNTTSSTSGVITVGGVPFISNPGLQNAFFGASAGAPFTTTGSLNTALGNQSLSADTTGADNTAVGALALNANLNGGSNVAVGEVALFDNTSGTENTAVGTAAGVANTTGNSNTFVGVNSNALAPGLTNATAIGANSIVGANNALVLGSINGVNSATSHVNVGIGTATPRSLLEISTSPSDLSSASPVLTLTGLGAASIPTINFQIGAPQANSDPQGSIQTVDFGPGHDPRYAMEIFIGNDTNNGGSRVMSLSPGSAQINADLNVSGMLTKGGGSFKIDDPIAPSEKYLSHSFVESPDMKNIYDGIVVTNARGFATIQMPGWFDALNRDFRYQLTVVGGTFAQALVASEIKNGKFTIRTSKPRVKISWQVTGIRHDAWANAHRIPTEEEKPANEQGTYLHPELFGAPPEQGVGVALASAAHEQKSSPAGQP
ncbi:MAG TPA: hypothetical protein VGD60_01735 [Candidatus Acidoferrales bacterium]